MGNKRVAKTAVVIGLLSAAGALIWRSMHPRCIRPGCPELAISHEAFCVFHSDPENWRSSHIELVSTQARPLRTTKASASPTLHVLRSTKGSGKSVNAPKAASAPKKAAPKATPPARAARPPVKE